MFYEDGGAAPQGGRMMQQQQQQQQMQMQMQQDDMMYGGGGYNNNMNNDNGYNDGGDGGFDEGGDVDAEFNLLQRVRDYVNKFYIKMSQNKVGDVRNLYMKEWTNITNAYYKDTEWPKANEVANLCDNNEIFLLCYNELYYRHIFVNGDPQIHHRFESWNNYRTLFDAFLDETNTKNLILPPEWLNDMVDEFLYQFQDFCRYKHDRSNMSDEEVKLLEENTHVWQTETVLGYLTSFVQRSNIVQLLGTQKGGFHGMHVLQSIGYFSIFGLCRLQCLLADYRLAVDTLKTIDVDDKRALFTRVSACHVSVLYYLGFAYLMMRRYADAVNVFSAVLLAHRGTKGSMGTYAGSQIGKRYDQIRALTAMAASLCPGLRLDQQVHHIVSEKHSDNTPALTRRDEATFEKLFSFSCPKFIVPGAPDFSDPNSTRHQQAYQLQLKWFLHEVRQQSSLPIIRSYLKLYTSIPIEKLARFCDMPKEKFREHLMALKSASSQVVHQDGTPPLEGELAPVSDIHFYVVGDMVHISSERPPQRYSQTFLSHAIKFQQAIDDLNDMKNGGSGSGHHNSNHRHRGNKKRYNNKKNDKNYDKN